MIDISVVIVSWNAKEYLLRCLESIIGEYPPERMEIVVVDNASVDGSGEAVSALFPTAKLARLTHNIGFGRANNVGIRLSSGRYLFLVNSDVWVLPGCLRELVTYMDTHPDVGMAGPMLLNSDMTLQLSWTRRPSLWRSFCRTTRLSRLFSRSVFFHGSSAPVLPMDRASSVEVLIGAFLVLRKETQEEIKGFDERYFMYFEDLDLSLRVGNGGWGIKYIPSARAFHAIGASSHNSPLKCNIDRLRSQLIFWGSNPAKLVRATGYALVLLDQVVRFMSEAARHLNRWIRSGINPSTALLQSISVIIWLLTSGRKSVTYLVDEGQHWRKSDEFLPDLFMRRR